MPTQPVSARSRDVRSPSDLSDECGRAIGKDRLCGAQSASRSTGSKNRSVARVIGFVF